MTWQGFLPAWCGVFLAAHCLWGQVIQLPTVESFSIGTTVVVPDRGTALVGGVNRAAYGNMSRGTPLGGRVPGLGPLFRSRSATAFRSSSQVSVTATIIDLNEMDRAVLAAAANRRRSSDVLDPREERRAASLAAHVQRQTVSGEHHPGYASVATERAKAAADTSAEDEARTCFEWARRAEAAGRWGAARCQYRRLLRTAPESWKQIAARRLSALAEDKSASKLASVSSTR